MTVKGSWPVGLGPQNFSGGRERDHDNLMFCVTITYLFHMFQKEVNRKCS